MNRVSYPNGEDIKIAAPNQYIVRVIGISKGGPLRRKSDIPDRPLTDEEDASVNLLLLIAIGWSASRRSTVGMVLAATLLVPCVATLVMAWYKFSVPFAPAPLPLI